MIFSHIVICATSPSLFAELTLIIKTVLLNGPLASYVTTPEWLCGMLCNVGLQCCFSICGLMQYETQHISAIPSQALLPSNLLSRDFQNKTWGHHCREHVQKLGRCISPRVLIGQILSSPYTPSPTCLIVKSITHPTVYVNVGYVNSEFRVHSAKLRK